MPRRALLLLTALVLILHWLVLVGLPLGGTAPASAAARLAFHTRMLPPAPRAAAPPPEARAPAPAAPGPPGLHARARPSRRANPGPGPRQRRRPRAPAAAEDSPADSPVPRTA